MQFELASGMPIRLLDERHPPRLGTSTPASAADSNWVISSPASAKALLSQAPTAFAANKTVVVHGNGGCNAAFTNREEVGYLLIQ